ncbi:MULTISPECIES: hypothetical protein [Bacillus]|uniref:hypothetical protein n=1 Tax=Bacillus TaxID=1386 RepID=UPI000942A3B6|nr:MULTISPECIES: hypothetical protein [Bacillus cereus group]MCQ6521320.1 hypothetical protein [Bacillus paranthracis]MCR6794448.1 hypothetical protein [Bacillus paranthracis]MCU5227989.1 hypothetical protein [Bacillus paranthracis]MCU5374496.1 hypothetical protein [Bacillus pacificus]MEC4602842.1 hypothetical protein [Bacillus paranthracis]
MFTITDLIISFAFGLLFIGMFLAQKRFFPSKYFSLTEVILETKVTYMMILVRIGMIFVYGLVGYLITESAEAVLLGGIIGSFLIIWPAILNPLNIYIQPNRKLEWVLIIGALLIFPIATFLIVYSSILLYPIVHKPVFTILRSQVVSFLFGGAMTMGLFNWALNFLDRKISAQNYIISNNPESEPEDQYEQDREFKSM